MRSAPLRFMLLLLGGWIGLRALMLMPDRADEDRASGAPAVLAHALPATLRAGEAAPPRAPFAAPPAVQGSQSGGVLRPWQATPRPVPMPAPSIQRRLDVTARERLAAMPSEAMPGRAAPPDSVASPRLGPSAASAPASASRWSGSAWMLVRGEGGAALAPGGSLGGGQAGARLLYRLGGGVSVGARTYLPLRRPSGAEAALGLDWRPVAAVPINIVAERRERIGDSGRSAFAVAAYGGASRALPGELRMDVYGQAGLVGLRSRDLFVDGSARITRPVGPVDAGAGAWAAAQPGGARIDAGPTLSYRLPVRGPSLRLQADWRFRLVGDAAPGSGPALVVAVDF